MRSKITWVGLGWAWLSDLLLRTQCQTKTMCAVKHEQHFKKCYSLEIFFAPWSTTSGDNNKNMFNWSTVLVPLFFLQEQHFLRRHSVKVVTAEVTRSQQLQSVSSGAWWLVSILVAFRRFKSRSSRHVYGPWASPSLAVACNVSSWKLRHSMHAVSGAPLSSSGLKEAL